MIGRGTAAATPRRRVAKRTASPGAASASAVRKSRGPGTGPAPFTAPGAWGWAFGLMGLYACANPSSSLYLLGGSRPVSGGTGTAKVLTAKLTSSAVQRVLGSDARIFVVMADALAGSELEHAQGYFEGFIAT